MIIWLGQDLEVGFPQNFQGIPASLPAPQAAVEDACGPRLPPVFRTGLPSPSLRTPEASSIFSILGSWDFTIMCPLAGPLFMQSLNPGNTFFNSTNSACPISLVISSPLSFLCLELLLSAKCKTPIFSLWFSYLFSPNFHLFVFSSSHFYLPILLLNFYSSYTLNFQCPSFWLLLFMASYSCSRGNHFSLLSKRVDADLPDPKDHVLIILPKQPSFPGVHTLFLWEAGIDWNSFLKLQHVPPGAGPVPLISVDTWPESSHE